MNDYMVEIFALFGVLCAIGVVMLFLILLFISIKEFFEKMRIRYIQKHRFDKKPIAKVYCIDCKYHNNQTKQCYMFEKEHRKTADNWFCWKAEPKTKEQLRNENKK